MKLVNEFEFNNDAIGQGVTNYKDRYLHVFKGNKKYLFYEIVTGEQNNGAHLLSLDTVTWLIENKRVKNYKKLKEYVKQAKKI